ncbi:MAG: prepilin-type N-terminal cleavage/methylation domain-containing protein [Planctomycetota bacterium]|nr:prepilin-type N-terminal cleavage/methylation domain-containing protein [Planctomycetota bacterium]
MNQDHQYSSDAASHSFPTPRGFTLVELLVVIGILVILIGILLPSLSKAHQAALSVVCESNLSQIGQALLTYSNQYDGYLFPKDMGYDPAHVNPYPDPGDSKTVYNTWPVVVFGKWNPPILLCPSDENPAAQHSYVLNSHMGYWNVKYSSGLPDHRSPSDVVLMGEKITSIFDYYMEYGDFDRIVEQFRHGLRLGSNYLMLDMHVDLVPPNVAKDALDPWDFANGKTAPPATTKPSGVGT